MVSRSAANFAFSASMRAAHGGAVVERAGQGRSRIWFILSRAPSVCLRYLSLSSARCFRIHGGRPEQDVGGEAALGIDIARNVADGPDDLQPALRDRNLVHRLVFRDGDIDREAAADGGKRDDGGGQQGTDFHGIWAVHEGAETTGCVTVD